MKSKIIGIIVCITVLFSMLSINCFAAEKTNPSITQKYESWLNKKINESTGIEKQNAKEFIKQYNKLSASDKEKFASYVTNPEIVSALLDGIKTAISSNKEISLYNGDFTIEKNSHATLRASKYYKASNYFTGTLLGIDMMQIYIYCDYYADGVNINSIIGGNALTTFCYVPCTIEYTNGYTYTGDMNGTTYACYTTDVTWYFTFEWAGFVMRSANLGVGGNPSGGVYHWANDY